MIAAAPARARRGWLAAAAIGAGLIALAFAVAPRSCQGGLEVYAVAGMAAMLALVVLPFLAGLGRTIVRRLGLALVLVSLGAAVWVAGMAVANVRFICGLGYL